MLMSLSERKKFNKLKQANKHRRSYSAFREWFKRLRERYFDLLPGYSLTGESLRWVSFDREVASSSHKQSAFIDTYLPETITIRKEHPVGTIPAELENVPGTDSSFQYRQNPDRPNPH